MTNDNKNIDFMTENLLEFFFKSEIFSPTIFVVLLLAIGFFSYAINN
ncbi:MAG: hypothetical protein RLZZ230_585 [Candidatus Parcubacteria bacterium]|jgi:hypothetical protein